MTVEIGDFAKAEVRAAIEWYRQVDEETAYRFEAAFERAIERIEDAPERWPRYEAGTRRVLLSGFPYLVVYKVTPNHILVVAVSHQHQKPGYWRRRLR